jgi:UDP-4-amino-4,6-dideoxy-L-N-acetyl-beta-L-altrosamine transaminase
MINLFEFDDCVIDTSTFDHYLHGSIVREFEEEVCEYVGAKYAASFFSASYAIYAIIKSKICVTPNVITIPSMIPAVVPNALVDAGASIKFNSNIDWVGGAYNLCDGIIDSAQQFDKHQYKNNLSNNKLDDGEIMIFSFYPTKPLSSLDGGIVVSNNKEKIDDLKSLSFYGMDYSNDSWTRVQKQVGFKAYMSTMQATIASRNLKKLDQKYQRIDEIRERYNDAFALRNTSRHLYRIEVDDNLKAIEYFKNKGIVCGIHYSPQHLNPVFKDYNDYHEEFYYHEKVTIPSRKTLSIPFHHKLSSSQIEFIIREIKEYWRIKK